MFAAIQSREKVYVRGLVKFVPAGIKILLPQLAHNILATMYKDFFSALYAVADGSYYPESELVSRVRAACKISKDRTQGGATAPNLRDPFVILAPRTDPAGAGVGILVAQGLGGRDRPTDQVCGGGRRNQ